MESPPGPHPSADSASSGELVDKTPVGIAQKHVPWRSPARPGCSCLQRSGDNSTRSLLVFPRITFQINYLCLNACFWENLTKTLHTPFPALPGCPSSGMSSPGDTCWFIPVGSAFLSPPLLFLTCGTPPTTTTFRMGVWLSARVLPTGALNIGHHLGSLHSALLIPMAAIFRSTKTSKLFGSCGWYSHSSRVRSSFFPSHEWRTWLRQEESQCPRQRQDCSIQRPEVWEANRCVLGSQHSHVQVVLPCVSSSVRCSISILK